MTEIKNILVTGGAGFIGHHLVNLLIQNNYEVMVIDDLSMGKRSNLNPKAGFYEGDIRDTSVVKPLIDKAHAVCHLAAKVSIRSSLDNFMEDADVNLMGTLNLLKCLKDSPVKKFCFASSMAVYADNATADPIDESHPTIPISPYGQAKLAAEYYVKTIAESLDIDWFNLRLFNTYGPAQTFTPYVGVITIFTKLISQGKIPTIFDNGEQNRDYVNVNDIVQCWLKALEAPESTFGVFNVGTGAATSVNELAAMILQAMNSDLTPKYEPANALELRNSIPDISAAKSVLNYQPKYNLRDELPKTITDILDQAAE